MPFSKDSCIRLLQERQQTIGTNRYVKRDDFSDEEVAAIKSFFGPWPRALEQAGIKQERDISRLEMNRDKRARARKRRQEAKKATLDNQQGEIS